MQIPSYITASKSRVEACITEKIQEFTCPSKQLKAAMEYSLLNGGKRVRAALVYAVGEALHGNANTLDTVACAIECIHAFSLVHDDLPALDNDDLRRGKPTCHKVYGSDIAILAGDSLIGFAFMLLGKLAIADNYKLSIVQEFAAAHLDLCAGEAIDVRSDQEVTSLYSLKEMHILKTAKLIVASLKSAALASECPDQQTLSALTDLGIYTGLAYQIHDDILDVEGDSEKIGKPIGSDIKGNKITCLSQLGVSGAKNEARIVYNKAINTLDKMTFNTKQLKTIIEFVLKRNY
jgi:farnesyl diphosphate synthase